MDHSKKNEEIVIPFSVLILIIAVLSIMVGGVVFFVINHKATSRIGTQNELSQQSDRVEKEQQGYYEVEIDGKKFRANTQEEVD